MAYLGLARKWRPLTFDDLVGQEHIALTLSNAIKSDRVGQGYLFTGTRGVGKTSAARIFAKALRCQDTKKPGIPCNKCQDCTDIGKGSSVDVLEIDGASNNGVDAVREIRENAKYLPSTGKKKIYIIDEVHMLTTAAFNALLKTLEEPPAHVFFIFATTDPQKIPATVLSRCQRFDFKRISEAAIKNRLEHMCKAEKIKISDDALSILSREAEGSMRDGTSLLDQVLAVNTEKELNAKTITTALGLVDRQTIIDCVEGILKREPLKAIEAAGKVHTHGFDLKQFSKEILRYLRLIMLAKLLANNKANASEYLDVSDVELNNIKDLTETRSLDDLDMLFRMLNQGLETVSRSPIPKIVLDVLLLKMASSTPLVALNTVQSPEDFDSEPMPVNTPAQAAPTQESPAQKIANMIAEESTNKPQQPIQSAAQPKAVAAPTALPKVKLPSKVDLVWWKKAIAFVKARKPMMGTTLEHLGFQGAETKGNTLLIKIGYDKEQSFYKDQLESKAYQEALNVLFKEFVGKALQLEFTETGGKSIVQLEDERTQTSFEKRKKQVLESDAIKATEQLLGARLEKLELQQEERN